VRQNESAITIIALALGVCLILLVTFGNFSLAYLVKLFSEGRVPVGKMFMMLAVTAAMTGILGYLIRAWVRSVKSSALLQVQESPQAREGSRSNHQQQWQEAKATVLELAKTQASFDVSQVMRLTELDRAGSEYLLDELLTSEQLTVYEEQGIFKYRLK
jgi:hypothetical protein